MTQRWIVIGDSIPSGISGGPAAGCAITLVGIERDIMFKSIASGGASLGQTGNSGFNTDSTTATLDHIAGAFNDFNGILIMAGTNDFGASVPWQDMVTSMYRILDFVRARGKKALVMEPIWRGDQDTPNALGYKLDTYRYFEFLVCTQPPSAGGYSDICWYGHKERTILGSSAGSSYFNSDLIHPTSAGQRKLADWIELEAASAGFF